MPKTIVERNAVYEQLIRDHRSGLRILANMKGSPPPWTGPYSTDIMVELEDILDAVRPAIELALIERLKGAVDATTVEVDCHVVA